MTKYKVALFDLDNTLLKTEDASMAALTYALNQDGVEVTPQAIVELMGLPGIDMARELGSSNPAKTIDIFNERINQEVDLIKEYDGIDEMFAGLRELGIEYGIVTSKLRRVFDDEMRSFPKIRAIEKVVLSDDTKKHKPHADPIEFGMQKYFPKLNRADVIYVGDSLFDMQSAHAAGVDFANAGWGAIPANDFSEAEYILKTPTDLLEIVK
ncbi:HAD family hydrolase [Pediococcus pentosaceus]|uniref:HAD family hydrolase n=1 Tax=Pediococcus pentosaceus TaxID=1255 RepID=UPI0039821231